jgi:hypothetical protein
MTGEMSRSEVTPEAYPAHFAIAKAYNGSVEPFDQYQGPYVLVPGYGRLWVQTDDGSELYVYSERFDKRSEPFPMYWQDRDPLLPLAVLAVSAAREVLPPSLEMG